MMRAPIKRILVFLAIIVGLLAIYFGIDWGSRYSPWTIKGILIAMGLFVCWDIAGQFIELRKGRK
jgi:hypothetical protein